MLSLKIIQTNFISSKAPSIHSSDTRSFGKHGHQWLCRSKSDDSSSEASPAEGDPRKQELLAKIAMLQAQKLRLTDYLDERSTYLTQFAEEANAEIDAIGENALKDLDQASARIMENIESRMQAFEETAEMSREEIAKSDKEIADVEGEIEKGRNEGLFFKSLMRRTQREKEKGKDETKKINELAKESAASKTRRNIYLALIGLLAVGVVDSFLSTSSDWWRTAILSAILVALLAQFIYEQQMSSKTEKVGKKDQEKK
ncbi:hypothetical protein Ancab_032201 [Ancistrocladus abbreviatus]